MKAKLKNKLSSLMCIYPLVFIKYRKWERDKIVYKAKLALI